MGAYIKGIGIISPQKTADRSVIEMGILSFSGNRLSCVEPDYTAFIDARQIRRMSRIIKMGVTASLQALKEAHIEKPGGIVIGTAYGCLEDTDSFLRKMVVNKEEMLNPTAFIFSTHNSIASQVALLLNCEGYNNTYVHGNNSFESALNDALLLLKEEAVSYVLIGGIDELTDSSFAILSRLGHYKQQAATSANLYTLNSKGSVAGEGAAFFAIAAKPGAGCYAEIKSVELFSSASVKEVVSKVKLLLAQNNLAHADLLISGNNGDHGDDKIYAAVIAESGMQENTLKYKHLCGEYPTSTAFAMWMGAEIIKAGKVQPVFSGYMKDKKIRSVLIYNHYKNQHHSLILLTAC